MKDTDIVMYVMNKLWELKNGYDYNWYKPTNMEFEVRIMYKGFVLKRLCYDFCGYDTKEKLDNLLTILEKISRSDVLVSHKQLIDRCDLTSIIIVNSKLSDNLIIRENKLAVSCYAFDIELYKGYMESLYFVLIHSRQLASVLQNIHVNIQMNSIMSRLTKVKGTYYYMDDFYTLNLSEGRPATAEEAKLAKTKKEIMESFT